MKRHILAISLLAVVFLLPQATVLAHGLPIQITPEPNAVLEQPPAQIEIFFNEALEPSFSSISVFNSAGDQVDNGDSLIDPADPTRLTVTVRSLSDGVYTVAWQVLSAVDGHITAGAYPFAVGNVDPAALAEAAQASQQFSVSTLEIVYRWLSYFTSLSFAGGTLFIVLVWIPAMPGAPLIESLHPIWKRLGIATLAVFLAANLFNMLIQAGQISGTPIGAPWNGELGTVWFTTRSGVLMLARLLFGLLLIHLLLDEKVSNGHRSAFGVSLLILLTISLGSHAATIEAPLFPVLADWIHLIAAGVWVGGLLYFVLAVWTIRKLAIRERIQLLARLIPRFSLLAIPSVIILILTGLYASVLHIGSWNDLTGTIYGQALILKLILIVPLLLLGAANLLVITRKMKTAAAAPDSDTNLAKRFRQMVTAELGIGVAILLSVSILTALPPADISTKPPAIEGSAPADDLDVMLNVSPGRVGVNTFVVTVTKDGQPLTDATEVALQFTPTLTNLPPTEVDLENNGDGTYSVEGAYFSLPDSWQVQVAVRRSDAFDAYANLAFDVGVNRQVTDFAWNRVAGGILVLLAIGLLLAWQALKQLVPTILPLSAGLSLALFIIGLFVYYRPADTQNTVAVNPIPPNMDSILEGEALYQRNCTPCHGENGEGDGPVGLTLNPPPADLTIHTTPGVHPDGRLYEWISDGFPGSGVMPAFRGVLSDDERWHLVNYLRTLAQAP